MRAVPVSDGIWWVGAIDWDLRDFHGYETPRGTTYNAYLVRGAKTALVDTVKAPFVPELLSRVRELIDPSEIDYIVVNHVEPDHNGGLPEVIAACPNAKVVASKSGVGGVAEYHDGLAVGEVGAEDVIDLGGKTLHFLPVPMVHWPDSMFTFCPEVCTLMPNDAFGQHLASSQRFAGEVGLPLALEQLGIYYANILMPLGKQVSRAVEKVVEAGWECKTMAPSHGVIWREPEIPTLLETYRRWTSAETEARVTLAYGTMWGSTRMLAQAVADGISAEGVPVRVFDLADSLIADVTYDLLEARAFVLGTSTLHHGMLYRVAGYLQWLEGLKPPGKLSAVFGSFGWGGGAAKAARERLEAIGFTTVAEPYQEKFRPTAAQMAEASDWGRAIARAVKEPPASAEEA
ncbi:MAG TPA: FprA family A-type flavoprotein [Coriobacteriia bacterium]|jgi:flavorubredoxin